MPGSPLRISFVDDSGAPKSRKPTSRKGKADSETWYAFDAALVSFVPSHLQHELGTTWTARPLSVAALRVAADKLVEHLAARPDDLPEWRDESGVALELDVTIPLLLLGRDLGELGRKGAVLLDGA